MEILLIISGIIATIWILRKLGSNTKNKDSQVTNNIRSEPIVSLTSPNKPVSVQTTPLTGTNKPTLTRNIDFMYNGVISRGITEIPFGSYTLENYAGFTNKGNARRAIYRNVTTNELYVIFGIDSYPELWDEDELLIENLVFGFSKSSGKLTKY